MANRDGEVLLRDMRVAFCRCGASENKPLCDGAHLKTGFQHDGSLGTTSPKTGDTGSQKLHIVLLSNGPLLLKGAVEIQSADGQSRIQTIQCALCRCGGSKNKPFCDGTHTKIGFTA